LIPGNGIYAVQLNIGNQPTLLKGMMSIGIRPTLANSERTIEVNIFDFDKDIYGQTMRVFVKKFLRAEVKFNTLEELVKQIDQDKINSLQIL